MEGEFVEMGKLIGAGLACTGMGGAAIGVGHVVGNYLSGALRNPNAAAGQTATMFIGIAWKLVIPSVWYFDFFKIWSKADLNFEMSNLSSGTW